MKNLVAEMINTAEAVGIMALATGLVYSIHLIIG